MPASRICLYCREEFTFPTSRLKYRSCKYCSRKCLYADQLGKPHPHKGFPATSGSFKKGHVGFKGLRGRNREQHPCWKGGRYVENGYTLIYDPEHPSNKSGYVFEHRLVVEKHIHRQLTSEEIVHHKNKHRSDNRIENLQIMTRSEHSKHHNPVGTKIGVRTPKQFH